jgi:hypothetical protein
MPLCARGSDGVSPNGRTYLCVDHAGTLRIFDVETGRALFERDNFGKPLYAYIENSLDTVEVGDPGSARFTFSPDSRYVIAQPEAAGGAALAWDCLEKKTITLRGNLKFNCRWQGILIVAGQQRLRLRRFVPRPANGSGIPLVACGEKHRGVFPCGKTLC